MSATDNSLPNTISAIQGQVTHCLNPGASCAPPLLEKPEGILKFWKHHCKQQHSITLVF